MEERVVRKGKEQVLLRHWVVGDRGLVNESWRTLMALDRSPLRRQDPLYVVRLETPINGRDDSARQAAASRLDEAAERLAPVLQALSLPPRS